MLAVLRYKNHKSIESLGANREMGLRFLVPILVSCVILPWSSGNPNTLALSGNVAQSMDNIRETIYDTRRADTHPMNGLNPNLWRRDGNPGTKL